MTLTTLARSLSADGRFSVQDAARVLDEATTTGAAPGDVRELLDDPSVFGAASVDPSALRQLREYLSAHAPSDRAIGALPDGSQVFLKEGAFVASPDDPLPATPQAYGQQLYRAARLFAEPGLDVTTKLTTGEKAALTDRVLVGIAQARPGDVPPPGYDSVVQAAQQRSASATVLREVVTSLKDGPTGEARLLQDKALTALLDLVRAETDPGLRDHMAFHLHAIKDDLSSSSQVELVEEAYEVFAPTHPPYDEWFKDGNQQLNVVCHTGTEFYESEIELWKRDGYTVVEEPARYGQPTVLEKTYKDPDGEEVTLRLSMYSGKGGTFDDMDADDMHVVAYSGHASWGRNMPAELQRAPDADGPKKAVFIHQCCGQGVINEFRDKYPDTDLMTTRYSSYEREDHFAFKTALEGFVGRQSWSEIHDTIAADEWSNRRNNYLTPADEFTRMKTRDRDHDGRADLLDRLYDFDTFDVPGDVGLAFVPKERSERDRVLGGERVHNASQIVNTTLGFSHYLQHMQKKNAFVGGGFFAPERTDPDYNRPVRLVERDVSLRDMNVDGDKADLFADTQQLFEVQLNERYAHMPEEVVKAVTFFEVCMQYGRRPDRLETLLQSLMLVAHSLDVDDEWGSEGLIYDALREHYGLPEGLSFSDAKRHLKADSHVYAGSHLGLTRWLDALPPALADEARLAAERL